MGQLHDLHHHFTRIIVLFFHYTDGHGRVPPHAAFNHGKQHPLFFLHVAFQFIAQSL